ncbi:MAG: hypothetical protein AB7F88_10880 [Pyrinomonadaceae bacterium]
MTLILSRRSIVVISSIVLMMAAVLPSSAQRRDYLTDQEIEIVREAQDIDERIAALAKMIDRRFLVLKINVNGWNKAGEQSELWGELPTGSRTELFNDVKRILQKAVDDIDNLAANPNSAPIREKGDRRAKKDHERFPRAVRELAAAASRYRGPLQAEIERSNDDQEVGLIAASIELCDQILEAVGKLPPEQTKEKKEKKGKS